MLSVTKCSDGVAFHMVVPKRGYPEEIVVDIEKMLRLLHENIYRETPGAAAVFRLLVEGITYKSSPIWNISEAEPEVLLDDKSFKFPDLKVVCCNSGNNDFTLGKVYRIQDGWIQNDHGIWLRVRSLEDLCKGLNALFVELKE